MNNSIHIKVEQKHIDDAGDYMNCSGVDCPLARAMHDAGVPSPFINKYFAISAFDLRSSAGSVALAASTVIMVSQWQFYTTKIPAIAVDFMWRFDRGLPVKPIEFDLEGEDICPED